MKALKILHVVNVSAENYYLNNLCDYTDRQEIDFSFVTFAPPCEFAKEIEKRGLNIYTLNAPSRTNSPKAVKNLWKIFKCENPDIIHTHLFDPTIIGLTIAKRQRRKTVVTRHHSDALYQIPSKLKRNFYLTLESYINRMSDHIIAPSQMVRDILVTKENVPVDKVSIIPYGQTTERFDEITPEIKEITQRELGMGKNLALVCVSRLFHRKGHRYLFEAFAALTQTGLDATLYLVGTGDYQVTLEKLAEELGIKDKVRFLGWRNDALAIIAAADIIVHPSLEDALSSAIIESLMMERPIIATDISGVRDSLGDGQYGKIVPPADATSFRSALAETIANLDEEKARAIQGKKYLLEYMSAERVAKAHLACYKQLLNQPNENRKQNN